MRCLLHGIHIGHAIGSLISSLLFGVVLMAGCDDPPPDLSRYRGTDAFPPGMDAAPPDSSPSESGGFIPDTEAQTPEVPNDRLPPDIEPLPEIGPLPLVQRDVDREFWDATRDGRFVLHITAHGWAETADGWCLPCNFSHHAMKSLDVHSKAWTFGDYSATGCPHWFVIADYETNDDLLEFLKDTDGEFLVESVAEIGIPLWFVCDGKAETITLVQAGWPEGVEPESKEAWAWLAKLLEAGVGQ